MKALVEFYGKNRSYYLKKEQKICSEIICGNEIGFHFTLINSPKFKNGYESHANYMPKIIYGEHRIYIYIKVNLNKFDKVDYSQLNLRIKSLLYHELEHYLQDIEIPFREKLDFSAYTGTDIDYVKSRAEIEAYAKQIYFIHRQSKLPFSNLLNLESFSISKTKWIRILFREKIYRFLIERKDLNLLPNIEITKKKPSLI